MQLIVPNIAIPVRRIVIIRGSAIISDVAVVQVSRRVKWCTKIFVRVVYDVEYLFEFAKSQTSIWFHIIQTGREN